MIDDLTRSILEQRDNIENQRNKELNSNKEYYIKKLENKVQQLKEVIEEVREYIETQKKKPYKSLSEKATICNKYNELLQILDKVKGE